MSLGGRVVPGIIVGAAGPLKGLDALPSETTNLAVTEDGTLVLTDSAGGVARFVHTQASPTSAWTVAHNLGVKPTIQILISDELVGARITHPSANSALIEFSSAVSGQAICIG